MPIYEYRCLKCGEVFEKIQKINDETLGNCKFCHGKVERLISTTSFQLKGSGWYLTDYARKSEPSTPASDSTEKSTEKAKSPEKPPEKPSSTPSKTDKETVKKE